MKTEKIERLLTLIYTQLFIQNGLYSAVTSLENGIMTINEYAKLMANYNRMLMDTCDLIEKMKEEGE